jgi:phosphoglycolate phosphatase-like HAD superfamily hydrolase
VSAAAHPLLLLWDIDGTLLQRASEAHARALLRALGEVHGSELGLERAKVEAAGRTDGAIARDLLLACGVGAADIDREVEEVARRCAAAYEDLCPADLSKFVAPGIPSLLASLADDPRYRLSLVTGNFEPVARLKLARAGIGSYFEPGQGGFGTDAEAREELPPLARERAGNGAGAWPRERTVVIGDTPRDIACARADGLRVVAVTTGPFAAADLAEADHVAGGAADLPPLLDALAAT